jgi:hypothetical protein
MRKSGQGKKHILSALSYSDFLTADFFEQIAEVLAELAAEEGAQAESTGALSNRLAAYEYELASSKAIAAAGAIDERMAAVRAAEGVR